MDYFFTVRGRSGNTYSNKLGKARYLAIPSNVKTPARKHEIRISDWLDKV